MLAVILHTIAKYLTTMSHIVLLELVLVLVMSAGLGHGQFIQLSTADETSLNSTYLGTLLAGQPVPVTDL